MTFSQVKKLKNAHKDAEISMHVGTMLTRPHEVGVFVGSNGDLLTS